MSPQDKLDALLEIAETPEQQRALLRHPGWTLYRCDCGHYGLPYNAPLVIIDDDLVHAADLCQPRREWVAP